MGYLDQGVPMESSKKRKTRGEGLSTAETLAKWRDYNAQLESSGGDAKPTRKHSKGPKKGCKKGKGGPENSGCNYRGVRQRTWGKWVVEICEPNRGKKLSLGTFDTADDATSSYDEAARAIYGASARLNFPEFVSTVSGPTPARFKASANEEIQYAVMEAASLVETNVKDESTAMPSTSSLVKDESTGDNGQKELLAYSKNELFDDAELTALFEDIPLDFTYSVLDFGFDVNQLGFPDIEADMPSLVDTEGKDKLVNEYFDADVE
ncbi:dehydration-responsive element-binding protein 2A-like [Quercus suber]|uniref:Dehydration-responsive element-binding protein 2h n=1 Tax=Quercus suber TaxID=58331 RepID=A0AAW0J2B0_QUESU|nr:dehydration-responsive element-binding protein 2A-like [Quercus suber]